MLENDLRSLPRKITLRIHLFIYLVVCWCGVFIHALPSLSSRCFKRWSEGEESCNSLWSHVGVYKEDTRRKEEKREIREGRVVASKRKRKWRERGEKIKIKGKEENRRQKEWTAQK